MCIRDRFNPVFGAVIYNYRLLANTPGAVPVIEQDTATTHTFSSLVAGVDVYKRQESKWDRKYPSISKSWRTHWPELITFLKFPAEIRKAIYTTNAIESVNRSLRKISKNRGVFPHQDALLKLYYLALERIMKKWTMPIHNWSACLLYTSRCV